MKRCTRRPFRKAKKSSTEGCSKFKSPETSSGEIGLDIRTHASPTVGQDQVSGGVSVLCWHAARKIIPHQECK